MTQRFNSLLKQKKIDVIIYKQMARYLKQKKLMGIARKMIYYWETNYQTSIDPMATMYLLYKNNQLDRIVRTYINFFKKYNQFEL